MTTAELEALPIIPGWIHGPGGKPGPNFDRLHFTNENFAAIADSAGVLWATGCDGGRMYRIRVYKPEGRETVHAGITALARARLEEQLLKEAAQCVKKSNPYELHRFDLSEPLQAWPQWAQADVKIIYEAFLRVREL